MHPEEYVPQVTVAGLVVARDGDILLIRSHDWKDHYTTPVAKVAVGKTREQALVQSMKDSYGIDVEAVQYALTCDSIFSDECEKKSHFVIHVYIAKMNELQTKEDVLLADELDDFVWMPPFEAKELLLTKETKIFIDWYITHILK